MATFSMPCTLSHSNSHTHITFYEKPQLFVSIVNQGKGEVETPKYEISKVEQIEKIEVSV